MDAAAGAGGGPAPLPLRFSLNGQQYVGPAAPFVVYGAVDVDAAAPLSGPTAGGTLLTFGGLGLANGSDYRCRFGEDAAHVR